MSQSIPAPLAGAAYDERASMRHLWWLFLVLGLISILVGILAISSNWIFGRAAVIVFGVLLLIAGGTEVIHAVTVRNGRGFAVHLLTAALYLLVGVFILEDPDRAAKVLTLLLAASFFVGGVLRIVTALAMHFPAWPWVVLHGVVDLLLGIIILPAARDPESSLWIIGLFVGLDLLFHGWSWVVLALDLRRSGAAPSA